MELALQIANLVILVALAGIASCFLFAFAFFGIRELILTFREDFVKDGEGKSN